jgi:hypothetical protein
LIKSFSVSQTFSLYLWHDFLKKNKHRLTNKGDWPRELPAVSPWARKGLEGCAAATARSAGAGAIAKPRKARFFWQGIAPQSPAKKMRPNSSSGKFLTPHS